MQKPDRIEARLKPKLMRLGYKVEARKLFNYMYGRLAAESQDRTYKQHYSMLCWTALECIEQSQFTLFESISHKQCEVHNTIKYIHNQKNADKKLSTSVKLHSWAFPNSPYSP